MQKQKKIKKQIKNIEISGSKTVLEKIKGKIPWVGGKVLRKPKIIFPKLKSRRLSLPIPSKSLSIIVIYIILFLLQMGIIYLILRDPPVLSADDDGNPIFIWPENLHEAFIIESIVASILILLFSSGFFLIYHASKYVYNKKFADWILFIGILVIVLVFSLLQYILYVKVPKPPPTNKN